MSFDSLLTHTVHLERDASLGTVDEYNQPQTFPEIGETFRAAIQPRTAREMALLSQAGAPVSDYQIFMRPRVVSAADKIVHTSAACALAETKDLPDAVFEIAGIRNAVGIGHHLEVDANLTGREAVVAGS